MNWGAVRPVPVYRFEPAAARRRLAQAANRFAGRIIAVQVAAVRVEAFGQGAASSLRSARVSMQARLNRFQAIWGCANGVRIIHYQWYRVRRTEVWSVFGVAIVRQWSTSSQGVMHCRRR